MQTRFRTTLPRLACMPTELSHLELRQYLHVRRGPFSERLCTYASMGVVRAAAIFGACLYSYHTKKWAKVMEEA